MLHITENLDSALDHIKKFVYNLFIKEVLSCQQSVQAQICVIATMKFLPVFITKNGKGDLAVMSIEAYEQLIGRYELYGMLQEGLSDVNEGKTRPFSETMSDLRNRHNR